MAAQSKAQLLTEVHTLLKKRYRMEPRPGRLSVLEAVIYALCHEGSTREQANQALSRFKDEFFDWNEVRVSTIEQIQGVLAGLPEPEARAQRIRRFLRQMFEKTYGFTLEALLKKPLKEAVKTLHEYEAFHSDYVLAAVMQNSLGGHAIPVDGPTRRALARLGVTEEDSDTHALRGMLERAVPKNRGTEFSDLIEELTHDTCVAGVPDCPRCELRKICPTGQARLQSDKSAARASAKAAAAPPVKPGKIATPAPAPPAAAPAAKNPATKPPKGTKPKAAEPKPVQAAPAPPPKPQPAPKKASKPLPPPPPAPPKGKPRSPK